jgi:hypothetical protein
MHHATGYIFKKKKKKVHERSIKPNTLLQLARELVLYKVRFSVIQDIKSNYIELFKSIILIDKVSTSTSNQVMSH